jgi:hypothetical protein
MSEEALVMVMYGVWIPPPEGGREAEPIEGRGEVVPLRPELLSIAGAVSDPRARRIDALARPRIPLGATLLLLLALSAVAWGLVFMAIWAIALLWRWAEPALTVLSVGVALAVVVYGIGMPG